MLLRTSRRPAPTDVRRAVVVATVAAVTATLLTAAPAAADPYGLLDEADLPPAGELIVDPAPARGAAAALRSPDGATTSSAVGPASVAPAQSYNGEISGVMGAWGGYSNGQVPTSVLCTPAWAGHHRVRCDANAALADMNVAYRQQFGVDLSLTSTYRTYEQQVELRARLGNQAAVPGTSNHGWGLAIDFGGGINTFGTAQHNWMRANANRFGWYHPRWAQIDGSLPEAWHWEYAGAVASGLAGHNRSLALELARVRGWSAAAQQQCLDDLWYQTSRWNHGANQGGDLRGLPRTSMVRAFGTQWTSSSTATAFLRIPQRQVERGMADLAEDHGNPCAAWAYWGPQVGVVVSGPATVLPGGRTTVDVRYDKDRAPVPSANVHLQELRGSTWVDAQQAVVTGGTGRFSIQMGSTTTWFRVRNFDTSAVSPQFRIDVAEVRTQVTGPTTVPAGGRSTVRVQYLKDAAAVPAATVHLQEQRGTAWVDTAEVTIVDGVATADLRPGRTTTTYRVRNWNDSARGAPFTIGVAEVRVDVPAEVSVPASSHTRVGITYLKDDRPVPSAEVVLQEQQGDRWVDAARVPVTDGTAVHQLRAGYVGGTYRVRNFDTSAVSPSFTTVVTAPQFHDVGRSHPFLESVNWIVLNGVATGYADNTYRPNGSVSRQAMAAFLYRMAGSPAHTPPAQSPFADVRPGDAFYAEITWLAGQGITTGSTLADGRVVFRPSAAVSREAMAAFLHRYQGSPAFEAPAASPFSDMTPGQPFYAEVTWLAAEGISTGTTVADGRVEYRPARPVSRQAMAAFLQRIAGE